MEEFDEILKQIQETEADFNEFEIWMENGIERGWITEPFCNTHDGDNYMTEEEMQEWEEGGDPCQVVPEPSPVAGIGAMAALGLAIGFNRTLTQSKTKGS